MTRDAATFRTVCRALYGERWAPLAADGLGVAVRVAQRWGSGWAAIPGPIWGELAEHCRTKRLEIHRLEKQMRESGE